MLRMRAICAAVMFAMAALSPARAVTVAGTYYEDAIGFNCGGLSQCLVQLNELPDIGRPYFLTVTEVSCRAIVQQGMQSISILIANTTPGDSNFRREHFMSASSALSTQEFRFREEVNLKLAGGPPRTVVLRILANAASIPFSGGCVIVGVISSD